MTVFCSHLVSILVHLCVGFVSMEREKYKKFRKNPTKMQDWNLYDTNCLAFSVLNYMYIRTAMYIKMNINLTLIF